MTSLDRPPRAAAWLIQLFALPDRTDSILGDLAEEFDGLAARSGVKSAQGWYWRQTLKTLPHAAASALRASPWLTLAAVIGGFFLRRLTGPLPELAIFAFAGKYRLYDHHFIMYQFLASTGIDVAQIGIFLLVGCAVALVAKGTEMPATLLLAAIHGAMVIVAFVVIESAGMDPLLWRQGWYLADILAIVLGGAIVRMRRQTRTRQPLNA
ncbi:MAG TPA: permease prefix domain 2-containing transporter [Terracidiphilus sp.]|nr:permease prefix domain 2-containing transporter [Terracidiphilus sp.]